MKITDISLQVKNPNRVNISIDGTYRFSLDVYQVGDLGLKVGRELSDTELAEYKTESQFGKLYARTLEYCLMRPHSSKEVRDYLYKKTRSTKSRNRRTGQFYDKPGVSPEITNRVYDRLVEKGYIDDRSFARYWIENRNMTKGTSHRKLEAELRAKGVENGIIQSYLDETERNDEDELQKVIAKKRARYADEQKFMRYLARQGFRYDDIKAALSGDD